MLSRGARGPQVAWFANKRGREMRSSLPLLIFLVAFSHAVAPIAAGARSGLSVTDSRQDPGGDV